MGEGFDPLTTSTARPLKKATMLTMALLIVLLAGIGFALNGRTYGAGVLVGGLLSYVNFFWLDRSTRAILEPNAIATSGLIALKFIARYAAIAGVLLVIYLTNALPIASVILGLAAYAIALFFQGLKGIFDSNL